MPLFALVELSSTLFSNSHQAISDPARSEAWEAPRLGGFLPGSGLAIGDALASGDALAAAEGSALGSTDGFTDGSAVGSAVGSGVGSAVGAGVGSAVGAGVGSGVGAGVGSGVGAGVGSVVGAGVALGDALGFTAATGPTIITDATSSSVCETTSRRMVGLILRLVGLDNGGSSKVTARCVRVVQGIYRVANVEGPRPRYDGRDEIRAGSSTVRRT